jgi:putative heme-binding domain-containing protein
MDNLGNEWFRRGVFSSVLTPDEAFVLACDVSAIADEKIPANLVEYRSVLRESCEMIGAGPFGADLLATIPKIASTRNMVRNDAAGIRLAVVAGVGRGFLRRGTSMAAARWLLADLEDLEPISKRTEEYALGREFVDAALTDAIRWSTDSEVPLDLRLEAIGMLQVAPFVKASPVLLKILKSDPSQEVRLVAVDALASFDTKLTEKNIEPPVGPMLLDGFSSQTPAFRRRVLQAMLKNPARIGQLLAEIEAKRIAVSELDPATVQVLTNHKDDAIRDRSRKLLAAAIPADRKQVLEKYQPALALAADAKAGRAVFEKNCATCHKIGDLGVNVAPEISDSRTKTPAQLLTDILNPNQAIDNNYVSYTVVTKDGKTETGIIATETATSITLKQPEGKTVLILRQEIDELRSSGVSLMPEGLEKNISVEQMADLIAFIKNWRYLDGAVPLGRP